MRIGQEGEDRKIKKKDGKQPDIAVKNLGSFFIFLKNAPIKIN